MQDRRRNIPMIALAMAVSIVVTGCSSVALEATDLSALSADNDRAVIEQSLGPPEQIFETPELIAAVYGYRKSQFRPENPHEDRITRQSKEIQEARGRGAAKGAAGGAFVVARASLSCAYCPILVLYPPFAVVSAGLVAASAAYGSHKETRELGIRPTEVAEMVTLFDPNEKLLFVGTFDQNNQAADSLEEIVSLYNSAVSGNAEAQLALSKIALFAEEARELRFQSAAKGNVEAQYQLGNAYKIGEGVEKSDSEAVVWWRKAADKKYTPAYMQLGNAYRFGWGVAADEEQAKVWLKKAANAGNQTAAGILMEMSRVQAEKEFESLLSHAENGNSAFQVKVAEIYRFGTSRPKDITRAIYWYERAAAGNNDYAAYSLATIYADGEVGSPDLVHGYMWYRIAEQIATQDKDELSQRKTELSNSMTDAQIAEAELRAGEWPKSYKIRPIEKYLEEYREQEYAVSVAEKSPTADGSPAPDVIPPDTSLILADWRQRSDLLRRTISHKTELMSSGYWRFSEFNVVVATLENREDNLIRLETRYTLRRGGGPNLGPRPEPRSYERTVIVDDVGKKVVSLGSPILIN